MSSLNFRLVLILMLHLTSFMDLTISHLVLVHKRTALCLDALVTAHVLIVVIVSRVGMVFSVVGSYTHFEPRHLDGSYFPHRGSRLTGSNGEVQKIMKTSSCHMVKCWIPKIYFTNPSTESLTASHPM
jgi:hypothetical protein